MHISSFLPVRRINVLHFENGMVKANDVTQPVCNAKHITLVSFFPLLCDYLCLQDSAMIEKWFSLDEVCLNPFFVNVNHTRLTLFGYCCS